MSQSVCLCYHNKTPEIGSFVNNKNVFLTALEAEKSKIKLPLCLLPAVGLCLPPPGRLAALLLQSRQPKCQGGLRSAQALLNPPLNPIQEGGVFITKGFLNDPLLHWKLKCQHEFYRINKH